MPASVRMLKALATPMETTSEALHAVDQAIEQLCRPHEEYPLCASLPGAGPVDAARLTAALGTASDRWTTVDARLCCSGVAPVMESG
jgi:hypothetical protein